MSYSIIAAFAFVFGLAVGSFLNVCIYRLPLKKSIISPPSACPGCGGEIKFYDNVPVLGYIMLLGKCRRCREPISIRYPLIELLTGLLSLSIFARCYPDYALYIALFAFTSSLIVISFIDLRHQIIPDVISIPGIFAGLIVTIIFNVFSQYGITWYDSLIGAIGGGGILYIVAVGFEKFTGKEGMGGGDIKLLAMIGAWMGWRSIPLIILISSLTGSIIGAASLILAGKGLRTRIPFGPFLVLGTLVYLFFGIKLQTYYLGLFR
jgi:leader peptidase (prepilin peptidase) / N-methyltransferase